MIALAVLPTRRRAPRPSWRPAHRLVSAGGRLLGVGFLDDPGRWGDPAFALWSQTGADRRPGWPGLNVGYIGVPPGSPLLALALAGGRSNGLADAPADAHLILADAADAQKPLISYVPGLVEEKEGKRRGTEKAGNSASAASAASAEGFSPSGGEPDPGLPTPDFWDDERPPVEDWLLDPEPDDFPIVGPDPRSPASVAP